MGTQSTIWKLSSTPNAEEPVTGRPTGSRWDGRRGGGKHRIAICPIARSSKFWDIRSTSTSDVYWSAGERRQDQHHPHPGPCRGLAPQRPIDLAGCAGDVRTAGDDH